ncbi:ankyrin repeat domain-containing protein 54-like isoform X2 [Tachypleus tridentatus]|uniref:ankyrin repeat domain-containing protein 54-like isoform X2 n=1 Tax=Tachypleus tridentatus TaxID=6853 RepID=UPI003FD119AE
MDNQITDSGVETGSDSNESVSMSVESPERGENDLETGKEHVGGTEPPSGLSFLNVQPLTQQLGYNVDYQQNIHLSKIRPAVLQRKNETRWKRITGVYPKVRNVIDERKLRISANSNNLAAVQRLLDSGVDPCAADERRRSSLHFSACKGNVEICKLLLERGANPNQRDIIGNTPLHLAACTSNIEIVTLLLKAGTDINALDNSGRTPFHLAQSKLKLLQFDGGFSSRQLKAEVMQVVEMMQVWLERSGNAAELDFLNVFSSRIQSHQTKEEFFSRLTAMSKIFCSVCLT